MTKSSSYPVAEMK